MSGAAPAAAVLRCRVCSCRLEADGDNLDQRLCLDCATRPEGKRILGAATAPRSRPTAVPSPAPPAFSAGEQSLIRHAGAYMPTAELLRVLNERRTADRGAGATLVTLEQLHTALQAVLAARPGETDWGGLRRLLADARRAGVLAALTPTVITDFAVVFQLAPAQLTHLRDVIQNAKEDA